MRVGSTPDEFHILLMASIKSSKRSYSDSDSDSDNPTSYFPRFIVLESIEEKQLTKINPLLLRMSYREL